MALLQGIVTAVRNIRGEVNLPPSKKLRVRVLASDDGAFDVVHAAVSQLADLANLESLELVREMKDEPKKVATGVAGPVKVYVFLEGMIDFSVEKARLEKDIAKIARDLQFVSRKLANRDFREKASPEVVQKEEDKFNNLRNRNEILENALNHLREWEIGRMSEGWNPGLERLILTALEEDAGTGDVTTLCCLNGGRGIGRGHGEGDMVVAGLAVFEKVFLLVDPRLRFEAPGKDGEAVRAGQVISSISGNAAPILLAERTALNFFQRMSGIATLTRRYVDRVAGTGARILDTRKTVPGHRVLDKYAVRMGGGVNHRSGLSGGVLIKDNHIRAAGGVTAALRRCIERVSHTFRIEVETRTLAEVREALEAGAGMILLDNMPVDRIREAVRLVDRKVPLEASGGVTLENVREIAETGVDFISVGALTHSARAADISLNLVRCGAS